MRRRAVQKMDGAGDLLFFVSFSAKNANSYFYNECDGGSVRGKAILPF